MGKERENEIFNGIYYRCGNSHCSSYDCIMVKNRGKNIMLMTVLYIIMAIIFQIIFVMLIIFVVKRFIKYYLRQKKEKSLLQKEIQKMKLEDL